MLERIAKGVESLGIPCQQEQIEQMYQFIQRLGEKNKVMNLTAITQESQMVDLHLLDSLAIAPYIPEDCRRVMDIGTGAGFPAMPLKILRPDLEMTLLDALQKRLDWLEETAQALSLEEVYPLHGRGEDLGHLAEYRGQFDLVTARAVAELRVLAEISLPFVKVGGIFLAMKSCDCQEEITQAEDILQAVGGNLRGQYDYSLPHCGVSHSVLVIEKVTETPSQYPRRWAKIKKS